eukprot:jgi/Botrbrau1/20170/Bobra.0173s0068.1
MVWKLLLLLAIQERLNCRNGSGTPKALEREHLPLCVAVAKKNFKVDCFLS